MQCTVAWWHKRQMHRRIDKSLILRFFFSVFLRGFFSEALTLFQLLRENWKHVRHCRNMKGHNQRPTPPRPAPIPRRQEKENETGKPAQQGSPRLRIFHADLPSS